ncbi:MAG: L,D-transpeptidase [Chthoniobacterales bacterium]
MSRWLLLLPICLTSSVVAQDPAASANVPSPRAIGEILLPQEPPKVVPRLLDGADPGQASVHISLGKQRAYLSIGNEVAIDTPVSTGKPRAQTPRGDFVVEEKKTSHSSRFFGEYVDSKGNPVRSAVSTRTDAAPSGTTFRAVPVQYFLRLNDEGLALHAGPLPGYAAADAAVWLPADIAPLFFQRVKVGTPVKIGD